jgi:hypothetical protein
MLSNTSLSFISFINLFMIPFIGLRIYCNKYNIKWSFNSETLYLYVFITILNIPLTRVLVNIVESITSSIIYVETTKYTVIALLSCISLTYVIEAIKKFIQIDVTISLRKKEKSNEK